MGVGTPLRCRYPGLMGLAGTEGDRNGNLKIIGLASGDSLRPTYDFLMRLPLENLRGRPLPELLNWMRWGGGTAVIWECTLSELVAFIERWEQVNEHPDLYGIKPTDPAVTWYTLWNQSGCVRGVITQHHCVNCEDDTTVASHCATCDEYVDARAVVVGPRGPGTANLELQWSEGYTVANAAYHTRGRRRRIPKKLRTLPV